MMNLIAPPHPASSGPAGVAFEGLAFATAGMLCLAVAWVAAQALNPYPGLRADAPGRDGWLLALLTACGVWLAVRAFLREKRRARDAVLGRANLLFRDAGGWTIGPDGRCRVSEAWTALAGGGEAPGSRAALVDRTHPADRERFAEAMDIAGHPPGTRRECLRRLVRADGTEAWVLTCTLVAGGERERNVAGVDIPVSDSAVADAASSWEGSRAQLLFETAPVAIAVSALEGTTLEINERCAEVFGLRPDEVIGRNFTEITHPDDLSEDLELLGDLMAGRRRWYVRDKRFRRGDGEWSWMRLWVSVLRDPHTGAPEAFLSFVEDIDAAKKETARAARLTEALERGVADRDGMLSAVFNLIPEGVVTFDAFGRVEDANHAFTRRFGRSADTLRQLREADVDALIAAHLAERAAYVPLAETVANVPDYLELRDPAGTTLKRTVRHVLHRDGSSSALVLSLQEAHAAPGAPA